jgi:hypothetical protein
MYISTFLTTNATCNIRPILKGIMILTVNMTFQHTAFQWQTVLKFLMRHEDIHCIYIATLGKRKHNTSSQHSLIIKVQIQPKIKKSVTKTVL